MTNIETIEKSIQNPIHINPQTLDRIIKDMKTQQVPAWEKVQRTVLENKISEAYFNGMWHVLNLILNDNYSREETITRADLIKTGLWQLI